METWRAIVGTKGFIEVSNKGRVRSLLKGEPRILKTQADNKGYHRIRVTIEREKMSFKVHREVARAFIDNPNNLPQVNHIDGNKDNNAADNLEWCTNRDNVLYSYHLRFGGATDGIDKMTYMPTRSFGKYIKGTRYSQKGFSTEHNPNPPKAIWGRQIGDEEQIKRFKSVMEAEKEIGTRHVSDVLKGKRYQTKGWTFWYEKGGDSYSYSNH